MTPGRHSGTLPAILLTVAASCSFAVLDAICKVLTQSYPIPMVAWARYAFHVGVMAVILLPVRGLSLVTTRRPGLQALRGICLGCASICFFAALSTMPQAEATAIIAISPIMVSLAAVRWMGERAPRGTWLALGASFLGVLLIVRPGTELFGPAALLPVLASMFSTGYSLATRRLAGVDDGLSTLFIGGVVAMLVLSLLLPFFWVTPKSVLHLLLLLAAGAVGALGHLLLVRAYERATATTIAPFTYSHTVAALLTGWIVFGAFPDAIALVGIGLIVATGVVVAVMRR